MKDYQNREIKTETSMDLYGCDAALSIGRLRHEADTLSVTVVYQQGHKIFLLDRLASVPFLDVLDAIADELAAKNYEREAAQVRSAVAEGRRDARYFGG